MRIPAAIFLMLMCAAASAYAQPPAVRLVFFTADWCPNCRVLEPELKVASARVSGVARIDMDVSNPVRRAQSRDIAAANGVLAQHDVWIGRTGFAAVIDAASHRTIGCVTAAWRSNARSAAPSGMPAIAASATNAA
jgi:thiol-disulfide isomerase/thioredoxin